MARMQSLVLDLRDGLRALRASPTVAAAAVLSLGLGIGAASAIFALVDAVLLRPLPVSEPDRLVLVTAGDSLESYWATYAAWEELRERELFESAFAWASRRFRLGEADHRDFARTILASGGFFDVLDVTPVLGRTFGDADDRPDGTVAVVSHDFWKRRFGGTRDVLGRSLVIERVAFTIVGVAPAGFFGPEVGAGFDVAIPLATEPLLAGPHSQLQSSFAKWLRVLGRLAPGRTLDSATAALRSVQPAIREITLPNYRRAHDREAYLQEPWTAVAAATGTSFLRRRYEKPLFVLMVTIGLVLLISCGNVAHLLLARVAARRRELSLRAALGASRLRLARQLLTESCLLAGVAAGLGILVGHGASLLLVRQISTDLLPVSLELPLDTRVLAFTAVVGLATAILFGGVPGIRAAQSRANDALATGRPSIVRGGIRGGGGGALLVAQIAFSLTLVVAAGLFSRTLSALDGLPLGFEPERVLMVDVDLSRSRAASSERLATYERLVAAARSVPGVRSAAGSPAIPIGFRAMVTEIALPDDASVPPEERRVHANLVTPEWFRTMGTSIIAGRDFDSGDRAGAAPVAIVNQAFARRFLKGGELLGRVVREDLPSDGIRELSIVGVVEDAVYRTIREPPPPTIYRPLYQDERETSMPFFNVVVRPATGPPESYVRSVSAALEDVDRDLGLTARPLRVQVSATYNQERVLALLSSSFGALALLLASVGLYGMTAHAVSLRRKEIGVRMALGANPARVVHIVLGRIGAMVLLGILCGSMLSGWAVRFVESLLFGLPPRDPALFRLAAALLVLIAAAAGFPSARRAARTDPAGVLREDG